VQHGGANQEDHQETAEAQEGDKGLRDVRRTGGREDGRRAARARHGGTDQGA